MLKSVSKKLLSGLLALAMVLTLVAVPVVDAQAAIKSNGYKLTDRTSVTAGDNAVAYKLTGVKKGTKVTVIVTSGVYVGKTKTATNNGARKITLTGTGKTLKFYVKVPSTYSKTKANVKVTVAKSGSTAKTVLKDSVKVTTTNTEDKASVEVTLSDADGLQADGTALSGDTLVVSYGSALGTPQAITWYMDSKVAAISDFTSANARSLTWSPIVTDGSAVVYAVVQNKEGQLYTSNTITVTSVQQLVTASDFSIQDDYDTSDLAYAKSDSKAVASVTLNKDVDGVLYIYENSVSKYSTANATEIVDLTTAETATTASNGKTDEIVYTSAKKMTAANAIAAKTAAGTDDAVIKIKNADGSVTYMWQTTVTRGKSYKFVFDQDEIDTDDITGTGRADVTVTDSVVAPYITAPASIALTSATSTGVKVTVLDANSTVLSWLGSTTTALSALGFESFTVYNVASAVTTGGTASIYATSLTGKEGVFSGVPTVTGGNYWYAVAKTTAGIYGADSITLTSDNKSGNTAVVTGATWKENADNATSADIEFTNLVADAVVYLYNKSDKTFDAEDSSTYVSSAEVSKGDAKVTLTGAFTADDLGDTFEVVVVPKDVNTYAEFESSSSATLQEVASSVVSTGTITVRVETAYAASAGALEINGLQALNQFGGVMHTAKTAQTVTSCEAVNKTSTNTESAKASYEIKAATGAVIITVTNTSSDTSIDDKDGYSVTVLGSTIVVTNNSGTAYSPALNGTSFDAVLNGTKLTLGTMRYWSSVSGSYTKTTIGAATITAAGTAANTNVYVQSTSGTDDTSAATLATGITVYKVDGSVDSSTTATISNTAAGLVQITLTSDPNATRYVSYDGVLYTLS